MVNFNSTIFRTITDEVTGANKSIGLFGKSFTELKGILSSVKTNGLFKTSIVSQTDLNCITKYNNLIKDGATHQYAMEQATVGASSATAQMIKNANGNTIALNQMTLGAKAATVAMKALSVVGNMLAMYAITKLITAYSDYKEKLHDIAEEMSAQAKKSSDYVDNLLDLKTQLEEGAKSSDELTSAFKDQLEAMGYTETEIDNLINKYNGLSGAIDEATRKALENAKTDAYADVASASKALEIDSDGGLFTDILIGDYKTGLEQLDSEIEKILSDVATKTAQQGRAWIAKDHSAEGLYEYYNALKDVSRLIQETASETNNNELLDLGNAFDPTVYGEVTEAINKLKDSAELYGEAISRLHNADAQLELSDYLKTNDINSKETFDNYINGIKNNTEYSESYKQVLIDVANKAFPQFSQQAKNAAETLDNFGNKTDISLSISDTVNQLNTKLKPAMDSLKSAYQSIFTEDGFTLDSVSSSMLSSIQDSILALNNLEGADINIPIEDFEKFADVLTNVNTTEEQADDAFDNLATSIINGIGVTGQLSDETAGLVIQLLEEMGIVNANEVVTNALVLQKERLAQASKISSETTYEHAVELVNEAGASEIAGMALAQLALEKIHVNGQTISTSADIENIIALANAAGASAEALATLTQAKAILAGGDAYGRTQQDWAADILSQINNGTYEYGFNLDADDFKVDFKGVGKDSASKAGKDAGEAYKEALEDELSDLDKIIGYIGDLFNDEIDALETAKDNAIDALEEAKEKELDALEKQKSALEKYKDALEDANKERELAMSLQKAQYELQRMLSQKTALIYSENKGFHYVQDTEGIRDKRNEVENIELDIKLHEIDEQIEDIDSEIEDVEEKYEKLISDTEAYYDAQINSLKLLQEQVEAITKAAENQEILALLEKYGINVNDILSGNEEALAKLKDRYLEVSKALSDYETTGAMDDLATSSDKASSSVSKVADATTKIDDEKVANLSSAMEGLGDTSNLEALYNAFDQLKTIITEISNTLNGVENRNGLVKALSDLGTLSLGTTGKEATGLIGQFVALKDAIDAVTTAISGGAQGQNLPQGGAPTMQGAMTPSGSPDSAGTSGLTQAIEEQVNKAKELLPEEIDLFGADEESLLSAVTKVTTAIAGGRDSEGGKKKEQSGQRKGKTDTSHLMGALDAQYKEAEIKIPQERDWFNELATAIELCVTHLTKMSELLQGLTTGDLQFGLVNFHAQGTVGKAFAKGTGKYKGLPSSEKNALRSEYGQPELTVYPDGTTELTTEPTMSDLPKDTVIFNEEQTRRIMNGNGEILGKAFANGTDISTIKTPTNLPSYLRPLQEGDRMYDLMKKFDAHNDIIQNQIIPPVNSIQKNAEMMARNISNVNNNNRQIVNTIQNVNVNCTGVTSQEVAQQIGTELQKTFSGMSLNAYQKMSVTR